MATTYYSNEITAHNTTRSMAYGNFDIYGKFTLTAALVISDVIQMVKVPWYAKILSIELYCDDLDTGAVPTIAFDIGDGSDTNRFAEALTLPQGGGFVRGIQTKGGFCYVYTGGADTIDITVNTAPATGATSGDIIMRVTCCMDN